MFLSFVMMLALMKKKVEAFEFDLPGPTIPLAEQVRRGCYNYVDPAITAPGNFQLTLPAGSREIVLYDSRGFMKSDELIVRMQADGCVPAVIDDALACGAAYPERQRTNPVVFLGTIWRGADDRRLVPVLSAWNGERELDLRLFGCDWGGSYRFAAVRAS